MVSTDATHSPMVLERLGATSAGNRRWRKNSVPTAITGNISACAVPPMRTMLTGSGKVKYSTNGTMVRSHTNRRRHITRLS